MDNVIRVKARDIKAGDVIPLNGFMSHQAEVYQVKETKRSLLMDTSMGLYSFAREEEVCRIARAC